MLAAPVAFPAAGLAYDHANGTVNVPNAHAFNTTFAVIGTANAGAGTRDYWITIMQGLAFSLARRNPLHAGELDNMMYGVDAIDLPAVLATLENAINNGFALGGLAGTTPLQASTTLLFSDS